MSAQRGAATDFDRLRSDLLAAARPTPDLFHRVARRCMPAMRSDVFPAELSFALDRSAFVEAAHSLLLLAHPAAGYMVGRLPTGTAHVRLMIEHSHGVRPVDTFRDDGQIALAILDALISARGQVFAH